MKQLSLAKPHAIITVGIPGSGKSFFAQKFSDTFGAPLLDLGAIRQHTAGDDGATTLAHTFLRELVKSKQSIVIDSESSSRKDRAELAKDLREHGYSPLFVWVQTDNETARQRSLRTGGRDETTHDKALKKFSPPHTSEQAVVISGKHTYATQAKVVLTRLSAERTEISRHKQAPTRTGNIRVN